MPIEQNYQEILSEKLTKIAKKSLKPAKIDKNQNQRTAWRFELTIKNIKIIFMILILSSFLSGLYRWNSRVISDEEVKLEIKASDGTELLNENETAVSEIVIYISGDVIKSGVYKLPSGSRVIDGLNKAGGLTKSGKIGDNNLARMLQDGEQIDFSNSIRGSNQKVQAANKSSNCINLNSASASELDSLPGVGPVLAQRIIDWRDANGKFKTVEQLGDVDGIGKAKFSTISVKTCV